MGWGQGGLGEKIKLTIFPSRRASLKFDLNKVSKAPRYSSRYTASHSRANFISCCFHSTTRICICIFTLVQKPNYAGICYYSGIHSARDSPNDAPPARSAGPLTARQPPGSVRAPPTREVTMGASGERGARPPLRRYCHSIFECTSAFVCTSEVVSLIDIQ